MGDAKWIYAFEEGRADMRDILGGKGSALAEMTSIGLPVPPGFTLTAQACIEYVRAGEPFFDALREPIRESVKALEQRAGKTLGGATDPLLVSVRSGAAISMPGMMDTVLNLGLNDESVQGLAATTGDARFAYDTYRRFMQMFGNVVLGIGHDRFEELLENRKHRHGARLDTDLDVDGLREVIGDYRSLVRDECQRDFPQDPEEQLLLAIRAVFDSWDNERAVVYRRVHRIPDDLGTAVNVQVMVFGNRGDTSGTGVVFTRNPNTGEPQPYGEYLPNAQGEDVVAGIRTPLPVDALRERQPGIYQQLVDTCTLLERHYRDMQDIEFTVQEGRLFLLQTRGGKRAPRAALRIAHDLVGEGVISKEEAILRIDPEDIVRLLHRNVDREAPKTVLARGLPASPGAATGEVVFDADTAERLGGEGKTVILVRGQTTPDDIHGIVAAAGVLTSRGGMTCHAAIVARGMGKPCIVGCESLLIDAKGRTFRAGDTVVRAGDVITFDGALGEVYAGEVPTIEPEFSSEFRTLMGWADEVRTMGVHANADTPEDASRSRELGAEGIGLCRTEHMFMTPERLVVMRRMIMAEDEAERAAALDELEPMQQSDFEGILEAMAGHPVTIRLLDPPLHEFLPGTDELSSTAAALRSHGDEEGASAQERALKKVRGLQESNPMLGHRGVRLGITMPGVYRMQTRAIFQAAAKLIERGIEVHPEVMIPLVGHVRELAWTRRLVEETARQVEKETGMELPRRIGTMIEVPRAALTADAIATEAEFFSFGTNDLTQTTFGFSRDDAESKFLHHYLHEKILPENPFTVVDEDGVGQLVKMAVRSGRARRPDLVVGVCGEHGGDPTSIAFFQAAGLDYVSCSPFRVPIARLAAAQAALRSAREPALVAEGAGA
ncbi:MAG: pyruvate, phosphate dikinase [Gemmatimonadetes bacterium]|nr:pyruvate, phosphate dikinase [Gemmatimonadota bacterium]